MNLEQTSQNHHLMLDPLQPVQGGTSLIRNSSPHKGHHRALAHKKQPSPPRATIGPWAYSYCRVLGGALTLVFLSPVLLLSLELSDTKVYEP